MKPRKQVKKFKRMFGSSHFPAVLRYYSGFTKLANPAIQKFIYTHFQGVSCIADLLPLLHCFYEAQEPSLCKIVSPQFSRRIEINTFELVSSVDFLAIGYSVASLLTLSTNLSHLSLDIEIVDEQKLKLLLLELSKCSIGFSGAKSNKLQLYFRMQTLSEKGIMSLASHLRQSSITCILSIQNCSFQCDNGLLYLWEGLQTNSSLTELHINCGEIEPNSNGGLALKKMLETNKSLSYLNLSKIKCFNLAASFIFQGLQRNTTLVHLFLSGIGLVATEDTTRALTTMLQVNKTLKHLDLSCNTSFSNLGACSIFQGLRHNTSLVYLNLSDTGLLTTEDTALPALTDMLEKNEKIEQLDLSNNAYFLDSGVKLVSQGLQHNSTLLYLNLSNTGITDQGAEYIAQALDFLRTLYISHNNITAHGLSSIASSLQANTTLRKLNIDGNPISAIEVERVQKLHSRRVDIEFHKYVVTM